MNEPTKRATASRLPTFAPAISTCIVRPDRFDPARHLPLFAGAGFRAIELNCYAGEADFPWRSDAALRDLAAVAADLGIRIRSVHAPGKTPVKGTDETERRKSVDAFKQFVDIAGQLDAEVVVIHTGVPAEVERTAGEAFLTGILEELAAYAHPTPCVLGWENGAFGLTASEHLAWIRKFSPAALAFLLDNGHAHVAGNLDEYLSQCGLLLCGLHLQDNDGLRDQHAVPGCGSFAWRPFVESLVQIGYTGPLTLEIEARDRQHELPRALKDCMDAARRLQAYT